MNHRLYSGRRLIIWKNLRGFWPTASFVLATALGAGLFPFAPGTMGSLVGIPVAYGVSAATEGTWYLKVLFWVVLTFLGSLAAGKVDQLMDTHDNQNIVIDEVIGLGITAWTAGKDVKTWIASFILFRFFDIIKIPPVRQVDQWSKKKPNPGWAGFGVIADDIIAGFQGLAVVLLLQHLGIL